MPEKLYSTGVPTADQLASVAPSAERLARGPVLMIECFQKIPCDPCHTSCPTGAVLPFADLNDLPRTDPDKCTGCGLCVVACPGLAIYILDYTKGEEDEAVVQIPWEYLPVPEKGQEVVLTNRAAEDIG
ncbi:4Fe-4S binding protein, partial [bacterium]|nr:4Fe-4S binding protein [bacterium]